MPRIQSLNSSLSYEKRWDATDGGYPLYEQPSHVWLNDGSGNFTPLNNRQSFVFSPDADPMGPWGMWPFDYDKDGDWDFAWDQPSNFSRIENIGDSRIKFAENTLYTNAMAFLAAATKQIV